jgi:hypothetical protein
MTELRLTRTSADRRLYALEGVGTLRLEGLSSRGATAESGTQRWQIARRGVFRPVIEAFDATGDVVGTFSPRALRRASPLRWSDRELALQRVSVLGQRYVLVDGGRQLASIEAKSSGERPVIVLVDDTANVDPGLLMFAVFIVRALSRDAAATTTVTVSG